MPSAIRWLLSLTLPLYVLDQATKLWVIRRFAPPGDFGGNEEIEVIAGFFWLHRLHNTGVAFGQFNGGEYSNLIFGTISLGALVAIAVLWRKNGFPNLIGKTAAALLITGILGNLTDRLWHGYVVDFLRFRLGSWYERLTGSPFFASFNVADSCICVAAALLFFCAWQKQPAPSADPSPDQQPS
jgi:signal peptidase II